MKNYFLIFLVSFSFMTFSCQKDEIQSEGELIANELQTLIKENKITRLMNIELNQSWWNTIVSGDYGKNYKFQGQFVFIEGVSYNLNNLIKHQIASINDENGIEIKFLLLCFY